MIKKKRVYIYFIKTLICIILFLVSAILSKRDEGWKNLIYNRVYEDNISFSYFKDFYNRYLGGIFPIENISNSQAVQVFNDELLYDNVVSYEEGIEVAVIDYYLVPVIEEGIVVYIGEKKKYGNVVIVEGNDGVDIWYGNVNNINVPHLHFGLQLIFDESQKECDNEIWINLYAITKLLEQNKCSVMRNTESREFSRECDFWEANLENK